jgi:hypothetical protein
MGFLDKLLGRDKEAAESTPPASTPQATAEDEAPAAPEAAEGSEVTQSEQRLDNIRDQALRDEGRMP